MTLKASRLAFAIIFAGILGGCATVGPWDSQEVAQLAASDARMVAGDIVEVLVTEYAPGQTTFALSNGKPGTFGMALESQLRETGYAVAAAGDEKPLHALTMAYVLDELGQPGTYRVGVRVQPEYRVEKLYQIDSAGQLSANGGATVRNGSGAKAIKITPKRNVGAALPVPAFPARPASAKPLSLNDYGSSLDSHWAVQVIAGANLDDLERHKARLERQGREAHIVKIGTTGRIQALRVGPFDSINEARPVIRDLRAGLYSDAFLVEPKQGGAQ